MTDISGETRHHPSDVMDGGRWLIRHGRWWLPLTDADVERGALGVIESPEYRNEIALEAHRKAILAGDDVDSALVYEHVGRLAQHDFERTVVSGGYATPNE